METARIPFRLAGGGYPTTNVPPLDGFLGLNVGGVIYQTTRRTLEKVPDSLLAKLFTYRASPEKDKDGVYLIDGDGEMFKYILNYLRRGDPCLPTDFTEHELLSKEAHYYELNDLADDVEEHLRKLKASAGSEAVIEAYVREMDDRSQIWRIHGSLDFLNNVSVLDEYLHDYRKGSQCVEFETQHSMFPTNTYRRFPKTTMFAEFFAQGFRLHTTDSINILNEEDEETPWLRYVFVK